MVLSMDRWVGKVAIVTGASAGMGAAICEHLVTNGLIVAGIARRSELIEEHAKRLSGKKGKLYAVKADISKEEEVLKAFQWVVENLGHVHVLVNNAGINKEGSFYGGKVETWRQVFDVNVFGLCVATREAVKIMKENNINGHIIHINTTVVYKNVPDMNVYPASKHAVTALTETLRQEFSRLGLKIRITRLCPGLTATEMTTFNKDNSEERIALLQKAPILQPADIADGVIYVLSAPEHVQVKELTIEPLGERF